MIQLVVSYDQRSGLCLLDNGSFLHVASIYGGTSKRYPKQGDRLLVIDAYRVGRYVD